MSMIYDPERALWRPGRRSFLFMFGAAVVAPSLPFDPEKVLPGSELTPSVLDQRLSVHDILQIDSEIFELKSLYPMVMVRVGRIGLVSTHHDT